MPSGEDRSVDRRSRSRPAAKRRFSGARQHRAEHENRRAHLANHVVGRDGRGDLAGLEADLSAEFALLDAGDAVETPSWFIKWLKLSTSARRGRLARVSFSSVRSAQGIRVSAAFFAPEIGMSPLSWLPPLIQMLSIDAV